MVYLPTCTIKLNQALVNIQYINPMGFVWRKNTQQTTSRKIHTDPHVTSLQVLPFKAGTRTTLRWDGTGEVAEPSRFFCGKKWRNRRDPWDENCKIYIIDPISKRSTTGCLRKLGSMVIGSMCYFTYTYKFKGQLGVPLAVYPWYL